MDQVPSRTDQMATRAKEKLEKLNIGKSAFGSFIQKALGGISTSIRQTGGRGLDYPEVASISQACLLYTMAMSIFVEKIKFDILTGLFCVEAFLKRLWIFICELGPAGGLHLFEKIIEETNEDIQGMDALDLILFGRVPKFGGKRYRAGGYRVQGVWL